jgi:hypothetical protein
MRWENATFRNFRALNWRKIAAIVGSNSQEMRNPKPGTLFSKQITHLRRLAVSRLLELRDLATIASINLVSNFEWKRIERTSVGAKDIFISLFRP